MLLKKTPKNTEGAVKEKHYLRPRQVPLARVRLGMTTITVYRNNVGKPGGAGGGYLRPRY